MAKRGKPPADNTMHQEIVTLRQTLKTAVRQGWTAFVKAANDVQDVATNAANEPNSRASNGNRNNCMTMSCFQPTLACGLTRPVGFNSGMSPSSIARITETPFLRSR